MEIDNSDWLMATRKKKETPKEKEFITHNSYTAEPMNKDSNKTLLESVITDFKDIKNWITTNINPSHLKLIGICLLALINYEAIKIVLHNVPFFQLILVLSVVVINFIIIFRNSLFKLGNKV